MEYSELVQAIRENDTKTINRCLETLVPRLKRFLLVHMNASRVDAEDCAQETLMHTLSTIKENKLKNPDRILSYLLTSCRNNYLKMQEKIHEEQYDEVPDSSYHKAGQLFRVLDKERKRILKWCMEQLRDEYQEFMHYWFQFPDSDAQEVATHFGISVNNAWTRKHRIIKQLNECYQKKSNL